MVKFFINKNFSNNGDKKLTNSHAHEKEYKYKNFYIYIEYNVSTIDIDDQKVTTTESFSAYQNADFSGHGFLEVIHPALDIHQIKCNRSQISFGVVFELDDGHDIDSEYIPDHSKIVWKKNQDKYDPVTLDSLIAKSKPHKVKFGSFNQS